MLPASRGPGTLCWKLVSKAFLRQKATKVSKKAAKRKKRPSKQIRLSVASYRFLRLSAIFGSRVCTSPLRSHHNTRKKGINESTKKTGPPRATAPKPPPLPVSRPRYIRRGSLFARECREQELRLVRWAFPTCLSGRAESKRLSLSGRLPLGELLPLSILSRCR